MLVQGVPGLGKTLLAKALAQALGGEFKRIQGTPDLMPSDIIGVHVFDERERSFIFRPGPLFADVVLVDEINRAGPKTQAALLEAMEERQVSVERSVFALPADFMVLATQNPREFEGTYPLPESQLDRFMLRIDMEYPERLAEIEVLERYGGGELVRAADRERSCEWIERSSMQPAPRLRQSMSLRRSTGTCSTSRAPRASTSDCSSDCRRAGRSRCCAPRASPRACAARSS